MQQEFRQQLTISIIFIFVLFITTLLYLPGLNGSFIFDDGINLGSLRHINSDNFILSSSHYITENFNGGLGRPISLLTFAMQYYSWDSSPIDFKYINLMLHLLTGVFIFWLFWRLCQLTPLLQHYHLILPLFTATIWLIHPLHVSTVLYVVQRMAQLATLFSIIGLLLYVHGRVVLQQQKLLQGYFWTTLGLAVGVGLGTLSKENAVVTLLLVIVLELTLLQRVLKPRYWFWWFSIFIYLPSLLFASYLIYQFPSFLAAYDMRDYSLSERLLTQSRVLLDYIKKIIIPYPNSLGLFHDDFITSTDLFSPINTFFSIVVIFSSITFAFIFRAFTPIFAFGILWFFAAHSLEASFIPLLMYFEHRNYLPDIGLIFAVIYGLLWGLPRIKMNLVRYLSMVVGIIVIMLFASITWNEVNLWRNPLVQYTIWAEQHPTSRLALSHAANIHLHYKNYDKALAYTKQIVQHHADELTPYLLWLKVACSHDEIPMPDIKHITKQVNQGRYDPASLHILSVLVDYYYKGTCKLSSHDVETLFSALLTNPHNKRNLHMFYHYYAQFLANEKRLADAVVAQQQAIILSEKTQPAMYINIINWLLRLGQTEVALEQIAELQQRLNPIAQRLYAQRLQQLSHYAHNLQKQTHSTSKPE